MALTDIINQYSIDNVKASNAATQSKSELGKDDFLRLLVTQLKNQDPLDPLKNEDFIAQLAQFNSLEQMINLNQSFEQMVKIQQLSQASSLVGQPVAYLNADGTPVSGIALTVTMVDGEPMLQVGKDFVALNEIIGLGQASAGTVLAQYSYLIGKEVSWDNTNGTQESGVVKAVEIIAGIPTLIVGGDTEKQVAISQIYAVSMTSQ